MLNFTNTARRSTHLQASAVTIEDGQGMNNERAGDSFWAALNNEVRLSDNILGTTLSMERDLSLILNKGSWYS